jgi:hypothetical protein
MITAIEIENDSSIESRCLVESNAFALGLQERFNRRSQRSQRGEAATKAGGAPGAPIKRDHKTLFENGEPVRQETEPQIPQIAQIY